MTTVVIAMLDGVAFVTGIAVKTGNQHTWYRQTSVPSASSRSAAKSLSPAFSPSQSPFVSPATITAPSSNIATSRRSFAPPTFSPWTSAKARRSGVRPKPLLRHSYGGFQHVNSAAPASYPGPQTMNHEGLDASNECDFLILPFSKFFNSLQRCGTVSFATGVCSDTVP